MSHAIVRGKSGRQHEVDFEDSPVRVEICASEETVEIVVEADSDKLPQERRRFALINIPAKPPPRPPSNVGCGSEPAPDRRCP
jgi:hypothetical protein